MSDEILSRLRENKALKDIPIHFAIYIQSGEDEIIPGEFVAGATADDGIILFSHQLISSY